jgi:nitric oxide reductase subunit C
MRFDDPAFWRAGAISTIMVMSCVLAMLTLDSLAAITPGGSHVPPYTIVNRHIDYAFDAARGIDVPVIGAVEPLFHKVLDDAAATAMMDRGKLVIQTRACMDCHTFYGNGGAVSLTLNFLRFGASLAPNGECLCKQSRSSAIDSHLT